MVPTGDALQTDLCRRWLSLYPHTRMLNTYGATECSDDQCHYVIPVPPVLDYRPAVMTIGRPIRNTQVYILDEAMQLVPIGVVGELYIAGVGVGRGYLKEPDRTAATFVENPFTPGTKLYRSGDQARYLPDGTVEFIGRIGHLIKLRGVRIEPGEIQAVLARHPGISQATLLVHEFAGIGTQLVAYTVSRKGETVTEADLRAYLRQHLPDYMIPAYFVALEVIPLNANGKIDKRALPIPDSATLKTTIVAPRTPTEARMLELWQKVLGQENLSIHDNFFNIGGHSLLAMRLFSRIEKEFGKHLPLATIFRATTIAQLAALVTEPEPKQDVDLQDVVSCIVPIQKGSPDRPIFFCIHAHGGHVIYFHDLARYMGSDQPFYGVQAYGIDGNHQPMNRFEPLAAEYIRQIRAVQPQGPYHLGGECMGGTIAFEIARQLEAMGEQVRLLVMFDAFSAGVPTRKPGVTLWQYGLMFNLRRFRRLYLTRFLTLPIAQKPGMVVDMAQRTWVTLRRLFFRKFQPKTNVADPMSVSYAALAEAESAYRAATIATPITLFNSMLPWGVTDDETLGWQGHTTGGIQIERFPGMFDTLIEGPDVRLTAQRLRQILDRITQEDSAS
jgi:thioesterase domain-containing protein/acyl carrier protein